MRKEKKGKTQYRVELIPLLAQRVDELMEARGLTRTDGLTRIYEWLLGQSSTMQQHIFRQLPEDMDVDVLKLAWEQAAQRKRGTKRASSG